MTTTIKIELQPDLLNFIERYAKQINRRRDQGKLEQGYLDDNEETSHFAETAIPLFSEVNNEAPLMR